MEESSTKKEKTARNQQFQNFGEFLFYLKSATALIR